MEKRGIKERKNSNFKIIFFGLFLLLSLSFLINLALAETSGNNNNANLTVWDDTDTEDRYTVCSEYCIEKGKDANNENVSFYANYTNLTGQVINDSLGTCDIQFYDNGTWSGWESMTYNDTSSLWEIHDKVFVFKGDLNFSVDCDSGDGNVIIYDLLKILNTAPFMLPDILPENKFDINGDGDWDPVNDTFVCYEDIVCVYDFSQNVTEDDQNDVLIYAYSSANTTLVDGTYSLNSSTGLLTINVTNDSGAVTNKKFGLDVTDLEDSIISSLAISINSVNDAPYFTNLNSTHTWDEVEDNITFQILAYDEEGENSGIGYPLNFSFNITSCDYGEGSSRTDNVDCEDFFLENFSVGDNAFNLTMNGTNDFVGVYNITFNVSDGNTAVLQNTTFIVENINNAPYFTWTCDNTRSSVEDSVVTCWVNASDIDEVNNLTFYTGYSWFTFNNSQNYITIPIDVDKASALINFTTSDIIVGNWSIDLLVLDTDSENQRNDSTTFWFFIDNVNDTVNLTDIDNFTAYEGSTYSVSVNASDEDLLIPFDDKSEKVYEENLTFSLTNSSGDNVTWINIITGNLVGDSQEIFLNFTATADLAGEHILNLTVSDLSGNIDTKIFNITVSLNNIPQWNVSETYNFTLLEDVLFELNISGYVSDLDGDPITFFNESTFPSFNLTSEGIMNFTPLDSDVGFYSFDITATDGKTPNSTVFNFTINNTNDLPVIEDVIVRFPLGEDILDGLVNVSEDYPLSFNLTVSDDDLLIPEDMKDEFYREILNVTTTITNLTFVETPVDFNFTFDSVSNNLSFYLVDEFNPGNSNVGLYNILINVTDASNESTTISFNLSVDGVNDPPVLMNLSNQYTAIDNRTFYYRVNATDAEDNDTTEENSGLTFNYSYIEYPGIDILGPDNFNITTGEINFTVNSTYEGKYHINLTVNDSNGAIDYGDFWIYIYGFPNITSPAVGYVFGAVENTTQDLLFNVNHSIGDNLTYEFYLDNIVYLSSNVTNYTYSNLSLRDNFSYYGNSTNLSWSFTPTFYDESYGMYKNFTLIVYPSNENLTNASLMNSTINWDINIAHANHPLTFTGEIDDQQELTTNTIYVNLSSYFSDIDVDDKYYSQNVTFSVQTNSSPTRIYTSVSDWNLSVSSQGVVASERINVTGADLDELETELTSATSNNFKVTFIEPEVIETIKTVTKTRDKIVLLKLIFPGTVNVTRAGRVELPISLVNDGTENLKRVNLSYVLWRDGEPITSPEGYFNVSYFDQINKDETKYVMFTIDEGISGIGNYKITLNATVDDPDYYDWGEVHLNLIESNETRDQIVFTEQFIASNPECIEMKELIDRAKALYNQGRYQEAINASESVFLACQNAIAQVNLPTQKQGQGVTLELYFFIALTFSLIFGLSYYFYRRFSFSKEVVREGKV